MIAALKIGAFAGAYSAVAFLVALPFPTPWGWCIAFLSGVGVLPVADAVFLRRSISG